jgi:hypothetical protein
VLPWLLTEKEDACFSRKSLCDGSSRELAMEAVESLVIDWTCHISIVLHSVLVNTMVSTSETNFGVEIPSTWLVSKQCKGIVQASGACSSVLLIMKHLVT